MKLGDLIRLKEIVLAHKKSYLTKEQGKKLWYENYKKEILHRIALIEELDIKRYKYLNDINEYLTGTKKKLGIEFFPPEIPEKPEEAIPPQPVGKGESAVL